MEKNYVGGGGEVSWLGWDGTRGREGVFCCNFSKIIICMFAVNLAVR